MKKLLMFTGIFIIPFICFSQTTLILGSDFILSGNTLSSNPSAVATTTSLNNAISTLTNTDKALASRADSCSNAIKTTGTQITNLQNQINNLPASGNTMYYKYKSISTTTYTITEADSSTVIFFTNTLSTTTVSVKSLTKPISVKLVSVSKPILVSPNSTITVSSVATYKRISTGGAADLLYNTISTANLCGQITK